MKLLAMLLPFLLFAPKPPVRSAAPLLTFQTTSTGHTATLSWTASATSGVSYSVYGGVGSGNESSTAVNTSPINALTYTDSTSTFLVSGNPVCYKVKAFLPSNPTGSQYSAPSNEACATVPFTAPAPPVQNPIQTASTTGPFMPFAMPVSCLVSAPSKLSFLNTPITTETGLFQLTYVETVSVNFADAVTGLTSGPATAYGNLAAIVRANPATGYFDSYNSTGYVETNLVKASSMSAYRITFVVNVPAQTYSAFVNGIQIATNFGFRTKVTSLNNVAMVSETGVQTICPNTAV